MARNVAHVLIVEDEETLRRYVSRGLAKVPDVEVHEAATLAEALVEIDRQAPDVVLSDLDLPDRPGVELIGELGRRGLNPALTFVSAYARAFSAQIPRFAKVRVLEKPVSLDKLRDTVREDLAARGHGVMEAAPFGVPDYLQIACLGRHSVLIAIDGGGSDGGQIVVHGGVAWSAQDPHGVGEAAFARMALARGARVTCRTLRESPGERNLERSWEALLLDAARVADEEQREAGFSSSEMPASFFDDDIPLAQLERARKTAESWSPEAGVPPGALAGLPIAAPLPPPAPPPPSNDELFEDARDRGTAALLRRDYVAAAVAFHDAEKLRPGDRTVEANLTRLRQLGVKEAE
jgi:CheY-like chemotaxis protein